MVLISVVIPVYNGAKTIQQTINSVLNQTFKDWELIIIDDGSQDSTVKIIREIEDSRIRIFSYDNGGLSLSRNRGIHHAQGEYITFLDADDLWTSDKLEAQFQALEEHPEAAVAYSWTDYIDQSSQFLHSGRHITMNGDVYQHLLVNNFLENGSNPLIRKQALNQVGGFDSSINSVADWDMWVRLAALYQFVAVPLPQILYRVSTHSMSSQIKNQERECLKVIEKAFEQAPESLQSLKRKTLAQLYKYLMWKIFQQQPNPKQCLILMEYLINYSTHEPEWKKEIKFIFIMFIKSLTTLILPSRFSQKILKKD
ncbi:glycosyltransferase [Planktothrix agardhii]|jgi:glycosyltransferase involved in cell wall biosynthesis|uniref:glycosyltransferase n=1 Tax=Planktothrix agardhii TaxID=1160 RepID=UPI000DBB416D|nr:glycosyltransferase [Planktothrix agardhii]MCB8761398.1 glycosyltransferase [Planktothrix agardhii 1813]MCB8785183.1 glycosyltransferase [Planktothrix agardhii 1025]MCF3613095.1 glycosyltransferase [Planktothrix agardhii 1027]BBD54714.1 putative glycosyl transferase [Planktothrix agardhii NIES-204]